MTDSASFLERLQHERPVLLDGPTGTELQRRGIETNVPGWSAAALVSAPETIREIHCDYVAAGAEVLTANTFRAHARNLADFGMESRAAELTKLAVDLAREAASTVGQPVWVAGSQAPLGDCYRPQETPDEQRLQSEHSRLSENLAAAGADLILVETHPTLREALAATRAALSTGLPVITSFVCRRDGQLLSGESLAEAARAVLELPVAGVTVNCILADICIDAVRTLQQQAKRRPYGAYCNVGYFTEAAGWVNSESTDPRVYAQHAADWLQAGARLIGGCCGTTPEHLACLRQTIREHWPQ